MSGWCLSCEKEQPRGGACRQQEHRYKGPGADGTGAHAQKGGPHGREGCSESRGTAQVPVRSWVLFWVRWGEKANEEGTPSFRC